MTDVSSINFSAQAQTDSIKKDAKLQKKAQIISILQQAQGESKGKVRDAAIRELKAEGLWEGKENKDVRKMFGKKFTNFLSNVFTGKEAKVYTQAKETASDNKQSSIQAEGLRAKFLKSETGQKLEQAGYTKEQMFKILKDVAGNNTFDWSKVNSEAETLAAKLTQNAKNNVEFTTKDAKKIVDNFGFNREKAIDGLELGRNMVYGAVPGAVAGGVTGYLTKVRVDQLNTPGQSQHFDRNYSKRFGMIGAGIGAAVAGGMNLKDQLNRTEECVADQIKDVPTYADYEKYANAKYKKTPQLGETFKTIAQNFYTDKDGNLDADGFNLAIRKAGGSDSPLNREEAELLLNNLLTGKYVPEKAAPAPVTAEKTPEKAAPAVAVIAKEATEEATTEATKKSAKSDNAGNTTPVQKQNTDCETVVVQNGESPEMIAKRYGVSLNELLANNKTYKFTTDCGKNARRGFLVGQKIKLPAADCEKVAKESKKNLSTEESVNSYANFFKAAIKAGNVPCEEDKVVSKQFLEEALAS